jgi:hypothetical protein
VINWERFGDWIATVAVASFAWVSSLIAPGVPVGSLAAMIDVSPEHQLSSVMRWAQDDQPIEQVGEGTDVETLDEATPPANEADTTGDIELLDQGPPPGDQQDVELLDQGSLAVTTSESPAAPTDSAVPITTDVSPTASSAPFIPEGFGTGNVHVATGSAGFPVGLEDCHVGAVTGRAYVGVDCGSGDGSMFVGHAPSFEDFPFVVDENFPFDQQNVFADRGTSEAVNNVQTMVSSARGATRDANAVAPEINTSGASSVEMQQRARDRKPRVETENGRSKRVGEKRRSGSTDVTASESQGAVNGESTESKHKKKHKGTYRAHGKSAAHAQRKSKSSDDTQEHGGKKRKKSQDSA